VILIAKNKPAARRLHEAFRTRSIVKQYTAICHHRPPESEGEIAVRLIRDRDERGETKMRISEQGNGGALSRSTYRLEAFDHGLSRVEVFLDTGKTHQIRIHLAHVGAPVVGDTRYGDAALDLALVSRRADAAHRLYLHAQKIEVPAPSGGKILTIRAPLPDEFKRIMEKDRIQR
jgi:23S rRNA pseudouridine955/2504/2580 synthase